MIQEKRELTSEEKEIILSSLLPGLPAEEVEKQKQKMDYEDFLEIILSCDGYEDGGEEDIEI